MKQFHDCPYLVKKILLEKSIWRILNFAAALQIKRETKKFDYSFDCQRSFKVCVRYFFMLLYLKSFQKMLLYCLKIFCICLTSPNDPFVKEIYSDDPKFHDVMS